MTPLQEEAERRARTHPTQEARVHYEEESRGMQHKIMELKKTVEQLTAQAKAFADANQEEDSATSDSASNSIASATDICKNKSTKVACCETQKGCDGVLV